ncbi:hypothetical protein M0P48_00190 [Candidatus Gracilibacteria bacterium]|nr:hypothetical protein [Candidatus Gracilibacteria bacterium]
MDELNQSDVFKEIKVLKEENQNLRDELNQKEKVSEISDLEKNLRNRLKFTLYVVLIVFIVTIITVLIFGGSLMESVSFMGAFAMFPFFMPLAFLDGSTDYKIGIFLVPYVIYLYLIIRMKTISRRTVFAITAILGLSIIVFIPSCVYIISSFSY